MLSFKLKVDVEPFRSAPEQACRPMVTDNGEPSVQNTPEASSKSTRMAPRAYMYTSTALAGASKLSPKPPAVRTGPQIKTRLWLALKAQAQRCVSHRKARCKMPMAISCTARRWAPASTPLRSPLAWLETPPGTSMASRRAAESRSCRCR